LVTLFYSPLYEVKRGAIFGNRNAEDPDLLSHNLSLIDDEASLGIDLGPTVKVSNVSEVCTQNVLPPSTWHNLKDIYWKMKLL
jgi:hypothetical protein